MEEYGGIIQIIISSVLFVTNSTFLKNDFLQMADSVIITAFSETSCSYSDKQCLSV